MDNQFDRQTDTDPFKQGGTYQQGDTYQQRGSYQQGDSYQQGASYQQGSSYQQGGPYQRGDTQGNAYQQGSTYQQGNSYQQGNYYQQGNAYQQGNSSMGNGYGYYGANPGNLEPQKTPNIFKQFVLSFVPTQYDRLTRVKTGSMIGFVTLLVLLATVIFFAPLAVGLASLDPDELADVLPDFEIYDGQLYMYEDFLYDEAGTFVYMTEDVDSFTYEDAAELAEEGYRNIILAGMDGISVMQNGEYRYANFSDFGDDIEISTDWIITILGPFLMVGLVLGCIIGFVLRVCWYFLCAAVYLLFAMIISSIMKKGQDAGALFRTAVYAKVLMFVVGTVLSLVPFVSLSVPFLLRVVITIGFMGFAIAKLPDNNPAPITMGQGWR